MQKVPKLEDAKHYVPKEPSSHTHPFLPSMGPTTSSFTLGLAAPPPPATPSLFCLLLSLLSGVRAHLGRKDRPLKV